MGKEHVLILVGGYMPVSTPNGKIIALLAAELSVHYNGRFKSAGISQSVCRQRAETFDGMMCYKEYLELYKKVLA